MSSPPSMVDGAVDDTSAPIPSATGGEEVKDTEIDVDAEMEDTQDPNSTNTIQNSTVGISSNTLDNEYPNTETQPTNTTNATSAQFNRKDVTLREFLSKMDDYAPIIPDAVTAHYLTVSGLPPPSAADPTGASTNTTPLPLARLLALATQKFIADIAADAYQYSRIRSSNSAAANNPLGTVGMPGAGGVGGTAAAAGGIGGIGAGGIGAAGIAGLGGVGKGGQATQLGVQRSGFGGGGQGGSGQGKTVLTMEDLGMAVQEYGINVKRGEFYR